MTAARLTCGNSAGYDGTMAPCCMPVCDACLQKWIDARPVAVARPALHFVGFRGDEYTSARRVFGRPDFVHIGWDLRAQREIAPGDVVVFAKGEADQEPTVRSGDCILDVVRPIP